MLTREENELVIRTGPGTPMGAVMRRYWMPALLSWELPEPDCPPVRVKLLNEQLGRVGGLRHRHIGVRGPDGDRERRSGSRSSGTER